MTYPYKQYGIFIDGDFVAPAKGIMTDIENPATGDVLASVSRGTEEDVDKAVSAARNSFSTWRETTACQRSEILQKLSSIVAENQGYLAHIESIDSGKPIVETIEDIRAVADHFQYFAGLIRAEEDSLVRLDKDNMAMITRAPYGVVAQIIPWNYPFLMAGWKIAPALAAGNCVVIKPSETTPLSLLEFAGLTKDILPHGVLNIVTGAGSIVGRYMAAHPDINKVSFTGSTEIGKTIARSAADSVIPATLEMGGKSANIIFPDAPMEKAIEGAALGILYGQGQVCNAGSRLFVHNSIYQQTVDALISLFKKVRVGDPIDRETRMGTLISQKQLDTVLKYVNIGIEEGAELAYGGKRLSGGPYDKGYFMEPTLFTNVSNDMRIAREEIFGPVLCVIPFETEDEVIQMANDSEYGLAGACWTMNLNRALRVAAKIDTGLF